MLIPPPDWVIELVDTEDRLRAVASHLASLNADDDVSLDTEGGGSPYSDETLQTIQIATSRRRAFVIDVRACRQMATIHAIGVELSRHDLLKHGVSGFH